MTEKRIKIMTGIRWHKTNQERGRENMKLISWNVNGLRACMQKGFLDFFQETDADIFCLQETKLQDYWLSVYLQRTTFSIRLNPIQYTTEWHSLYD